MSYYGVSEEVADRVADLMLRGVDTLELENRLALGTLNELDSELRLLQLNKEEVRSVISAAKALHEHILNITAKRIELHQCIEWAEGEALRALRLMKDLDELGDVEYEGGRADVEHFLKDAARSLRAAQALKPTDKNGN